MIRQDWTLTEIENLYNTPLLELIQKASGIHQKYQSTGKVQVCVLLSIKTGGCTEDCAYCAQSARYNTEVKVHSLLSVEEVLKKAREAKANKATRFCMGAAWREVRDNQHFEHILEMIKGIKELGMEVCCTLGMLTTTQAKKLKEAGLHSYNHNLDTSASYYPNIVRTHTYEERLQTLENVRKAGIRVCCGGILGLGEQHKDRIEMLHTLSTLPVHPESVPINALVPIKGTPLATNPCVDIWDMVRMIATARILMPQAMLRLSAGRESMNVAEQALCFLAGANSIFSGDKLLTTPNTGSAQDREMFDLLGLSPIAAYEKRQNTDGICIPE